jgi:hypothetical protein
MKNWKKIFKIVTATVVIFAMVYTLALLAVKIFIIAKIEQATGLKTTISSLDIRPPFGIQVRGFEIAGLIKADRIYIGPSMRSLLLGRIAFNKILIGNPEFTYQRNPAPPAPVVETAAGVQPPAAAVEEQNPPVPVPAAVSAQAKPFPLVIKKLKVYSGKLHFIDTTAASGKITVLVKDMNFYITNLSTTGKRGVSNFDLRGNISWDTGEPDGKVSLAGWVDLNKKDIQANLKVESIDAIVFYPYYSTWVDLEKAKIKKAKLNFNCEIKGVNNDVTADCHLELADMVRSARLVDEPKQKAERITDAVLDMFKTMDNGRIVLDFLLHTKMDHPEFGFANFKAAFESKLMQARASAGMRPQDMLSLPVRWVRSGIKTGTDLSNAVIDGIFDLSNGVKHFFEDRMDRPASAESESK